MAGTVAAAAVLTAGLLAGCSSAGSTAATSSGAESIQLLDAGTSFRDVTYYAMSNYGFAAANHLKLSFANFGSGGGATAQIFAGGTGNVLSSGIDGVAAIGQKNRLDITVLGAWANYDYHQLVSKAGSPYRTLASLKGQTVAVSGAGSYSDYALRNLLRQHGLQPDKDVKIASISGDAAMLAAVEGGKVAAAVLTPPTVTKAVLSGQLQDIYKFESTELPATVYIVRTSDIEKDPAMFANFMTAYTEAVAKLKADPSFATKVATAWLKSRQLSMSSAVLQELLKEFLSEPGVWSTTGQFTQNLYDAGRSMLLGSGEVSAANFPSYQTLVAHAPAASR